MAGSEKQPVRLSPEQVCERVPGMTVAYLADLRKRGKGVRYYKPTGARGRVVLYEASEVDAWIRAGLTTTREDG